MKNPGTITALLREAGSDSRAALDQVFPLLMSELRGLARRQLRGSPAGTTLDTAALINEAWLRMAHQDGAEWTDRAHFLAYGARAMRAVLVDHARRHMAQKRGGGAPVLPLHESDARIEQQADEIVLLDDALARLEALNERQSRVVECLFFGGMTEEQTATALGVSDRTVRRDWVKARAWLLVELAPVPSD